MPRTAPSSMPVMRCGFGWRGVWTTRPFGRRRTPTTLGLVSSMGALEATLRSMGLVYLES